ncbi:hypothetical protein MYX07_06330 [Patescibacteria group bacterium AH-259-L07]|nr:hypothetical protein [Patescibacteria group bacterium AH-259-L07]
MAEKTKEYTLSCTSCGKNIKAKTGEKFQCCGPMMIKEECCVHDRPVSECKECKESCCVPGRPIGECKECKSRDSDCTC